MNDNCDSITYIYHGDTRREIRNLDILDIEDYEDETELAPAADPAME